MSHLPAMPRTSPEESFAARETPCDDPVIVLFCEDELAYLLREGVLRYEMLDSEDEEA
jgi:hypothetical protein